MAGIAFVKGSMKKSVPAKRKSHKSHPTPQWMSADVVVKAKAMDPGARLKMAEELERAASELREFKQREIAPVAVALVKLRPNAKKALLHFGECHGLRKELNEKAKLDCATRWFVEEALCFLQMVSNSTNRKVNYRKSEGLEDSAYNEDAIGVALEAYKTSLERDDETNESD
jgi:hypothetical protein